MKTRAGALAFRGEEALLQELLPRLEHAALLHERWRGFIEVGCAHAFLKYSALRFRPALRHATRSLVPWIEIPRLQEFANLIWLRERGFGAPRPLVAGVFRRSGLPTFQFLATEVVQGSQTLTELFERGPAELREPVLRALAIDVARLHELGFVHRDLFTRNLLLTRAEAGVRIHFLDAWRGGPHFQLRGPKHDLACLMRDGERLFTGDERRLFLETYSGERRVPHQTGVRASRR